MCKTLTTIGCIIVGAGLLGWYDLWHLVIGLPLLVGGMLICLWLWQRLRPGDEEEANETLDHTGGAGRQVIVGMLCGGLTVGLLAGAFAVASRTGLAVTLREPDCSVPLQEVSILAEGQAYVRIIEVVDVQLQQPLGATCRRALREHKARAFLALAEQVQGKERLDKLQRAREEAEDIPHDDLVQVITARQQVETQQQVIAKQERVIEDCNTRLWIMEDRQISMQETTRGKMLILSDERIVLFDSGKAELIPTALKPLKHIAALLNLPEFKEQRVYVEGHTDATGTTKLNQELSEARAARVAEVLAQDGVSKGRLVVKGYGRGRPIADNNSDSGRAQNRRVEIIIEHAQER